MRARGIDAVVVAGDATIAVNTFIGESFFPRLFFTDQGAATTVAVRADLSAFDGGSSESQPAVPCSHRSHEINRFNSSTFEISPGGFSTR